MKAIPTVGTQIFKGEGCFDLPVHIRQVKLEEDGETFEGFTSYWQPDEKDLERLINGGAIALTVIGGQPPVRLETVELHYPTGQDPRADKTIRRVK